MLPTITPPAQVDVQKAHFDEIQVGELIAFIQGPGLYVHRVLMRFEKTLITCGDNSSVVDAPVEPEHILGRVVRIYAANGMPQSVLPRERKIPSLCRIDFVHIWLFVTPGTALDHCTAFARACGGTIHVLLRSGIGVSDDTLQLLRRMIPPDALTVGVASQATETLESLPALLQDGRQLHFLIGCPFGKVGQAEGCLLPLDIAERHIRLGEIYEEHDPVTVSTFLLGAITACTALL